MNVSQRPHGRTLWFAFVALLIAASIATIAGPFDQGVAAHPTALFALITIAAGACLVAATALIAVGDRRELAEMGLLGTMLMGASVMPLVHGLTTPDVLFDETQSFGTSAFLTFPVALVAALPLLVPQTGFGRWAARHWRDWTLLTLLGMFVLAGVVVFFPDAISTPAPTQPITVLVSAASIIAMLALSYRQLRFYSLSQQVPNLIASISIVMIGAFAAIPMIDVRYGTAFWLMHVIGAVGVLGACGGLAIAHRLSPATKSALEPVLSRDPLEAFELGLSPTVHRFVADLEAKDEATRDHVARTCELAMRVGERFRLAAPDLRDLGLAALLHDVGKVNVPDDILLSDARLTDEQYEIIKRHPLDSEQMLRAEPKLANAATIARSHHERFDGRGYPDGLVGRDIPLAARIIAACDALDAMTHERPYRSAMSTGMAFAILREHAGSQWDAEVVEQVIAAYPGVSAMSPLADVGRGVSMTDTAPEIPDNIAELLATVDAEI